MSTDAKRKANSKYDAKLDKVLVRMPSGKADIVRERAEKIGISINAYINKLIDEDISKA